jgi:polysaccharide pyruvyl transferase WcaK-like protein
MAAHAGAPVLPVAYQPKVAAVLAEAGIAPVAIALDDLRRPDFDASAALQIARAHPAGVGAQIRAQALDAIRDLLPAALGMRA